MSAKRILLAFNVGAALANAAVLAWDLLDLSRLWPLNAGCLLASMATAAWVWTWKSQSVAGD
jgi:hypothetical protein